MYSKYLDYTEAAVRANHLVQAENDQKDIIIGHLKSDLYELKQIEGDFYKLNELIRAIDEKYSLLLDEKDRAEKEQRIKTEIDQNSLLDLREQIDLLRIALQKACLQTEELIRENTLKKRMNDNRMGEIHGLTTEIKALQHNNQRLDEQNRSFSIALKGLKEERKRLQEECDGLSALLDSNIAQLKGLQKQVRNSESNNARLDKTLHLAESDNQKLIAELKIRNEDAKKAENRLRALNNQINQMKLTHNNVNLQAQKNKAEAGNNAAALASEVAKGKELASKVAATQAQVRGLQKELDQIISEQERQRKIHFVGLDENKMLNGELDRLLSLISEYELVNKELLDEVEIYSDQDEQAINILNRREQMRDLISGTLRKVSLTGERIKQIKY